MHRMPDKQPLRLGIIGLGQAASQIIREIRGAHDCPWVLAAAADPRTHALEAFRAEFRGEVFANAADLCRNAHVDAVYIATPPWMHLDHTRAAAENGKHIICEKPLALSLSDCDQMVAVTRRYGVKLMAGHTHSFDAPIRAIQKLVKSGEVGKLHALNSWNFNEFNHRSRLTSELAATHGPLFNQGPHQIDVIRQIAGGMVRSVRASTFIDGVTGIEGGYVAYLEFENGVPATVVYDGRALFDTAELFWWRGEGGQVRDPGLAEKRRRNFLELAKLPSEEREQRLAAEKEDGRYGAIGPKAGPKYSGKIEDLKQPFFGLLVVSCEKATIRQSPDGLYLYTEEGRSEIALKRELRGRLAELNELHQSITENREPEHSGAWGTATLEVCFGILESAKRHQDVSMQRQVPSS
jgi:phthalate 4,5-cis-dihydrodiol dehydrogenase